MSSSENSPVGVLKEEFVTETTAAAHAKLCPSPAGVYGAMEAPAAPGVPAGPSPAPGPALPPLRAGQRETRGSRRRFTDVEDPPLWKNGENNLLAPTVVIRLTEHQAVAALRSLGTNDSINSYE